MPPTLTLALALALTLIPTLTFTRCALAMQASYRATPPYHATPQPHTLYQASYPTTMLHPLPATPPSIIRCGLAMQASYPDSSPSPNLNPNADQVRSGDAGLLPHHAGLLPSYTPLPTHTLTNHPPSTRCGLATQASYPTMQASYRATPPYLHTPLPATPPLPGAAWPCRPPTPLCRPPTELHPLTYTHPYQPPPLYQVRPGHAGLLPHRSIRSEPLHPAAPARTPH